MIIVGISGGGFFVVEVVVVGMGMVVVGMDEEIFIMGGMGVGIIMIRILIMDSSSILVV